MKNHSDFIVKLFNIESKEERYRFLNSYLLTLSPEELEAWKTNGHSTQLNTSRDENETEEKREKNNHPVGKG
jgi:predicted CopG family antitoxin